MDDSLAGLVLCGGAGRRMRPLTSLMPKVLLPLVGEALVDRAVTRLRTVTDAIAVNANESQRALIDHADAAGWHVGIERGEALGTAGPVANLRDWIDGRPVVVLNGDTYVDGSLGRMVEGWDGERVRVLVDGSEPMGPRSRVAGTLLPWRDVCELEPVPTGLWEGIWRRAIADGRLETVNRTGVFFDCATPADYLEANLALAGDNWIHPSATVAPGATVERSVIDAGCVVEGAVRDSVLLPGTVVPPHRRHHRAVVVDHRCTVLIRR